MCQGVKSTTKKNVFKVKSWEWKECYFTQVVKEGYSLM